MGYEVDFQRVDLHAMFDIRGDDAGMHELLASQQLTLPLSPNEWIHFDEKSVLRIGPMRCLLLAPLQAESSLDTALRSAGELSYVNSTCISDMYTAVSLSGDDVFSVLSQVTPLDIDSLPTGSATATDLFSTAGFIFRPGDRQFTLYFESSFFDYALERLQKSALIN